MISGLKPYPAYKDSGVEWLGKVPEHWQLRRTKTLLLERSQKGFPHEPLLAATQTKGVVRKEQYENRTVLALKDLHLLKLVCVGDFVISLRSFQGGIEHAHARGIISPAYTVLYASDLRMQGFLARLFKSRPFIENLGLHVTGIRQGQNIDYQRLSRTVLPVPSFEEQSAIVRFIDYMDRRIRRYIRSRQRLISLLNEQKQAIISQAVTRGLNPDVRLKPSGVEWLGDVPENWEMIPAKRLYREVNERSITGAEELLSVSHLTGVTPRTRKNVTMFMASSYVGHKVCQPGDLVINTMWAWMGALGVSKQIGLVSPSYGVYRPHPGSNLLSDYADILLRTSPYVNEYTCRSTGIRASRLRLYPEQFLRTKILCPPVYEQREILRCVGVETEGLGRGLACLQQEIGLLSELRTRLISDVVTGKLDVREAAAKLPDEPEEPGEYDSVDEMGQDESLDEIEEIPEVAAETEG